jgi:hypothetical protein
MKEIITFSEKMKRRRDDSARLLLELNKQEAILDEITRTLKRIKCTHEKNKFMCTLCNETHAIKSEEYTNGYSNLIQAIENNYFETNPSQVLPTTPQNETTKNDFNICIHGYPETLCGECQIMAKIVLAFCQSS